MFRRRSPRPDAAAQEPPGEAFTYVHEGTTVRGSVEAVGRMRVHGRVFGDVRVDGVLEVAHGGLVEGATVEASEVKVLGTVRAAVTARVRVEVWKDGTLEGDVTSAALDIEEGATFVGRSSMTPATPTAMPTGMPTASLPEAPTLGAGATARAAATAEGAVGTAPALRGTRG